MAHDIGEYLGLLTKQHRGKSKLEAWLSVLLQPLIDAQLFCESIINSFDMDTAVGAQLDILGQWIGAGRDIHTVQVTPSYLKFDAGPGFGHGYLKGTYRPLVRRKLPPRFAFDYGPGFNVGALQGVYGAALPMFDYLSRTLTLTNSQYRQLLRAKIRYNEWDGSVSGASSILAYLIGTTVSLQTIHDSQFVLLIPASISDANKAIINSGLFNFRPAGINLAAIVYYDKPVFCFDNTTGAHCGGFNHGTLS